MRQIESNIKGFTLIEVMIALIVLMIGILGLMRLTTYNFQRVTSANERNIGFRIAKMALEPDNIQPGTKCFDCTTNGLCKDVACSANATTGFMRMRVERTTQNRTLPVARSVGQLSENNAAVAYVGVTVRAGWGGNFTSCSQNVNGCSYNATLHTERLP